MKDYVHIVWRRKLLVLIVIGLGVAAVLVVGRPAEPGAGTYDAEFTLVLNEDQAEADVLLYQQVAVGTNTVVDRAAAILGPDYYGDGISTADALRSTVSVVADTNVGTLLLTVVDQPSELAAEAAINAYSRAVIDYATELRVNGRDEELEALRRREESILRRIDELDAELDRLTALLPADERARGADPDRVLSAQLASNLASLTTVQEDIAVLSDQTDEQLIPLGPIGSPETFVSSTESNPLSFGQRLLVGLALATVLGCGLAVALDKFDGRLFARRETEEAFGLPVLAEIPNIRWWNRRRRGLHTRSQPSSPVAESYRLLRSGVAHARISQLENLSSHPDGDGAIALVTSVTPGVGKTTSVANLAVAAVDAGRSVLVVSADLREPTLHQHFGIEPIVGITDAVDGLNKTGRAILEPFLMPTGIDGITILAHGEWVSNPGETLAQIRPLLDQARSHFDLVLVDTPPMLAGNDVSELIPFADLVLLVARVGRSTMDDAQWAEETATRLDAPLCGVVLIGSRSVVSRRRRSRLQRLTRYLRRNVSTSRAGGQPSEPTDAVSGEAVSAHHDTAPTDGIDDAATAAVFDDAVVLGDVDELERRQLIANGDAESATAEAVLAVSAPAPSAEDRVEHRNLPRFPGQKSAIEDLAAMTVRVEQPPKPLQDATGSESPDTVSAGGELDGVGAGEETAGTPDHSVKHEAESLGPDDVDATSDIQDDGYRIVSDQDDEPDQPPQSMSA